MNPRIFVAILITMILLLLSIVVSSVAANGTIVGSVKDSKTGEALPGANVLIAGTSIGAATDLLGNFTIQNVPPGNYTLRVSYIGYERLEAPVRVAADEKVSQDFKLDYVGVKSEEIVVSAQAEGQMQAINQQLSSTSIVNVVSADRIQELPDATAAESVSRLPGVSITREGGEGNKVIIRGLSSEHNKVRVEGIELASTDSENRSVDISMISPFMLEGIEVQKAVTADHDADAIGGTVDFKIREASPGMSYDFIVQGINNGLRDSYKDYKLVGGVDNRFFNNKLGAFFLVDYENRTRDAENLTADYHNPGGNTFVSEALLEDVYRDRDRLGSSLVFDYQLPSTKIKLVNFFSRTNTNTITYSREAIPEGQNRIDYRTAFREEKLSILTNSLELDHNFANANLSVKISRSESINDSPIEGNWNFRNLSGLIAGANRQISPQVLFEFDKNDTSALTLEQIQIVTEKNEETIWAYKADFDYNYNLSKLISGKLKTGGKYQTRSRNYDYNLTFIPAFLGSTTQSKNFIVQQLGLDIPPDTRDLPLRPFIGNDYGNNQFLSGDFRMGPFANIAMLKEISFLLRNSQFPQNLYGTEIVTGRMSSLADDYNGSEDYSAGYIMTEMRIGQKIEFNPGLRFEHNSTSYTGIRGDATGNADPERQWTAFHDTTISREDDFWLPMIHLRLKPTDWFDVRMAYTESISRPDYRAIIPAFLIGSQSIEWGNPFLRPSQSKNYDVSLSFHGNALGLFTIGGFYKKISDQIFTTGGRAIPDSAAALSYDGLSEFNFDDVIGSLIFTWVNNPNKGTIRGLEFEWQTHFWYLPSFLRGLVFNANYTHIFSETNYPQTFVRTIFDPQSNPPFRQTNQDTSFTARLIDQPDDIVNLAFGYDFKGFSGRVSMLYIANIFSNNNFFPELRGNTDDYIRWDISVSQKLPIKNLDLTLNWVNVNSQADKSINLGTRNPTSRQNYGSNIIGGLRYRF